MSDSRRRRPPLVAEKRYAAQPAKKKSAAKAKPTGQPRKGPKRPAKKPRNIVVRLVAGLLGWLWRLIWAFTWRVSLTAAVLVGLAVGYTHYTLPEIDALLDGRQKGSVTLLDANGAVFAWRGDQFGGVVTANSVSPHLKNAVVATEDKRFYSHFGLSPRGIASAVRINLREGRGPLSGHGGSTITQQTAKLLCLGVPFDPSQWKNQAEYEADCRRSSLVRKAKEAIFAMAMEAKYTKDEILTVYLNRAYMGGGAYGAEAAAQRFFGKTSGQLTPAESAMLAGLLTAPTALAPTSNLERSQSRAAVVVSLMHDQGYLSDADARQALDNPAQLSEAAEARAGGYFVDWVMSTGPEFFTRNTTEDVVIRTTLDPRIQTAAEEGMREVFESKVKEGSKAQAAIVVMGADGAVRAMVGGRKTKVVGAFNRATQALRQTGSSFKPFVYAAALDMGYSADDVITDERYCLSVPGSGEWCPQNYDRKYHGPVTLAEALRTSLNIPAVKVAQSVGLEQVRAVASGFGINSDLALGPALALGASESTLLEMTGAYAGILNGGSSVRPYGLTELRMQGEREALMSATGGIGERVIQEQAARELTWMMHKVVSEGTGRRAEIEGWQVAGKTGTTQAARDAWFIGFTADYVAGVWMGYDDNTPLSGVTGAGLPAEIWHEVMARVHEGLTPQPLPMAPPLGNGAGLPGTGGRPGGGLGIIDGILRDIFGALQGGTGGR